MSFPGQSLDRLSPTEELTQPRPPSRETWEQLYGPKGAAATAVRAELPSRADRLDHHLSSFALKVHGHPFQDAGESIGQDGCKPILEVLKDRHNKRNPQQPWHGEVEAKWKNRIREQRVIHSVGDGCSTLSDGLEVEMRQGDALKFIGDSDGCPFGTLAVRMHGEAHDSARLVVVDKLVDWMEMAGEQAMYEDVALRDWVEWDRLPDSLASRKWNELMDFLRDSKSVRYLCYTGADLLVHIATAHIFAPVIVYYFQGEIFKAVRFVRSADAASADEALDGGYTYDDRAHLPASTELWLRLGLLENGHYVLCVPETLDGEALLQMCEDRAALLKEKVQVSQRSRGHAVIALGPSKAGKSTIVQVQHSLSVKHSLSSLCL
jgi:hypothetical protein